MLIQGTRHEIAELQLLDFEHEKPFRPVDKDWLNVNLCVADRERKWCVTDACLTTAEVYMLAEWFYELYRFQEADTDVYFTEPALSIHYMHSRESEATLKIVFNDELKPEWCDEDKEYAIIWRVPYAQLQDLAGELYDALQRIEDEATQKRKAA